MTRNNPRGQAFSPQPMGQCLASNHSTPASAVFSPAPSDSYFPPTRTRVTITNTMVSGG